MIKLNIQLFGGRGANTDYGKEGKNTGGTEKPMPFYDKSDIYRGMSLDEFERRTRNRKNEYVGLYDDSGKIVIAGTSYNHGAVAIPTKHPDFKKVNSLTHNHPWQGGRQLGGSFSGADVFNHTSMGFKTTRANAREKTYIIKTNNATRKQQKTMMARALKSDSVWDKQAKKLLSKVQKQFNKKGKKLNNKTVNKIAYGYGTRIWKDFSVNSGYTYAEIKRKY